ncbi:MAG: hypothetical protein DMF60_18455 [Acidobacteria bacterium]|nr:MAG: hypothetical protein DMF60_18455 [Acidobacteriota bacterium]
MKLRLGIAFCLLVAAVESGSAQWLHYRDPRIPRTADGQPDLKAPVPRFPDGRVDLSGIWYPDTKATDGARPEGQTLGEDPTIRLKTEDGTPFPLLPAAEVEFNERLRAGDPGPASRCLPHTIVDYFLVPAPFKFVHTPGLTIMLFEEFNHFRQLFTDGRPFPDDMQPAWFGYSVGKWDGDAFVIETAGFNNRGALDVGTPLRASESLRTTERFRRPNVGSLQVQVTIADPTTFSRTWKTQTIWFRLMPDTDFIEHICENEKDFQRIVRQ